MSVNELMLAFLDHAEQHYRRTDGGITELNHLAIEQLAATSIDVGAETDR